MVKLGNKAFLNNELHVVVAIIGDLVHVKSTVTGYASWQKLGGAVFVIVED